MAPIPHTPILYGSADGMEISIALIFTISSLFFVASIVWCACCSRNKKEAVITAHEETQGQSTKSTIVGKVKRPPVEKQPDEKSLKSERKGDDMKTIVEGVTPPLPDGPSAPPPPTPAAPVTVIAASPKEPGKVILPAFTRGPPPPDAVPYNDPAYRTIGRDLEDPFGTSLSVPVEQPKPEKKVPVQSDAPKKISVPLPKSKATVSPPTLKEVSSKPTLSKPSSVKPTTSPRGCSVTVQS